jgi:hypothetical protein
MGELTCVLQVKVLPKTSREEIVGWEENVLKVRLKAPPEKGEANSALIAFLADVLDLPKQAIIIKRGATSRRKQLTIHGLSPEQLRARLDK